MRTLKAIAQVIIAIMLYGLIGFMGWMSYYGTIIFLYG